MKKDISFLFSENVDELNKDINSLIFNLNHPFAGKNLDLLKRFTKELIKAHANQISCKSRLELPKEAVIISSPEQTVQENFMDLNTQEFVDNGAFPKKNALQKETMDLLPRKLSNEAENKNKSKLIEETLKLPEKPKKKLIKINEEKIPLITSKISGEELAHATKKGIFYIVEEIELSGNEIKILNNLKKILEKQKKIFQQKEKFIKLMNKTAKKQKIDPKEMSPSKLRYFLVKHIINFGLIDPLLHDPKINKIICDGPELKIQVIRDGLELITNLEFRNSKILENFLKETAKKASQEISEENPSIELEIENFKMYATMGIHGMKSKFVLEKML